MADIRLNRLTLDNFKGCSHFEFAPMGRNCSIYGDNATGKTTVYDGLVWLLFGKDSKGRKEFDIKPLDADGEVADHAAITSVEAVLDCDGEDVTLKRTYAEKWTTKRGRSEAEFDGHESEYFVDEVPVKKNAFDAAVGNLVDESTFRLLTNVNYFPEQMKWQDRRSLLFSLANVLGDDAIMKTDERFAPLLDAKNGKTVEDYKKVLTAQRKGLAKTKTDTPARIDEQNKTVLELQQVDFDAIRAQRDALDVKLEEYMDQARTVRQKDAAAQYKSQQTALEAELKALEAENRVYRANQATGAEDREKVALQEAIRNTERALSEKQAAVRDYEADLAEYDQTLKEYRAKYRAVNAEAINVPDTCPTCGQKIQKAKVDTARKRLEADKQKRLDDLKARGEEVNARIGKYTEKKDAAAKEAADMEDTLDRLRADLAAVPAPAPVTDMPEYADRKAELTEQLQTVAVQIVEAGKPARKKAIELQAKIDGTKWDIDQMNSTLAMEARLTAARERIEELKEQAKKASEQLTRLDDMLFLIEEFSRFKARFVEDSVNGMFERTTFRLFRTQINGGLEECCDAVYEGVPYDSLNNGAKINVGVDIIKGIGSKMDAHVPLFTDNAEAVTRLWDSGSQQIRLVVDERAEELEVRYETEE